MKNFYLDAINLRDYSFTSSTIAYIQLIPLTVYTVIVATVIEDPLTGTVDQIQISKIHLIVEDLSMQDPTPELEDMVDPTPELEDMVDPTPELEDMVDRLKGTSLEAAFLVKTLDLELIDLIVLLVAALLQVKIM